MLIAITPPVSPSLGQCELTRGAFEPHETTTTSSSFGASWHGSVTVLSRSRSRGVNNPVPARRPAGSFPASFSVGLTTAALRFPWVPVTKSSEDFHLHVSAPAGRRAICCGETLSPSAGKRPSPWAPCRKRPASWLYLLAARTAPPARAASARRPGSTESPGGRSFVVRAPVHAHSRNVVEYFGEISCDSDDAPPD